MDYTELDNKLTECFGLSENSVFSLSPNKDGRLLEFVYPARLKGNLIPVDWRSAAGRAAATGRYYISNNVHKEKGFIVLAHLMSKKGEPIQKTLTYPLVFGGKVVEVIQIGRRGINQYESGRDFGEEDVKALKSVLAHFFTLHMVKTA